MILRVIIPLLYSPQKVIYLLPPFLTEEGYSYRIISKKDVPYVWIQRSQKHEPFDQNPL